jgi:hypothetical protein
MPRDGTAFQQLHADKAGDEIIDDPPSLDRHAVTRAVVDSSG